MPLLAACYGYSLRAAAGLVADGCALLPRAPSCCQYRRTVRGERRTHNPTRVEMMVVTVRIGVAWPRDHVLRSPRFYRVGSDCPRVVQARPNLANACIPLWGVAF